MADEPLSVLILAGGRSRRMGRDKAWLELEGEPLVVRVAHRILPLASEILFSASRPEPFQQLVASLPVPARVVPDQYPGAGPLAGMHAGISAARHDLVLVLATDMPFVNLELVRYMIGLADGYDVVVPEVSGRDDGELLKEPLHALYRRSCVPAMAAHLAANDYPVPCFFSDVRTRAVGLDEIVPLDPRLMSFFNVNTPQNWEAARGLILDHE